MAYTLNAGSEITRRNPADGPQITQMCAEGIGAAAHGFFPYLAALRLCVMVVPVGAAAIYPPRGGVSG